MGTLKLVLGFGIIVGLIYGSWMIIPPYFANYQFEDGLKTTALNSTYTTKSEEEIRATVLKEARELDIPLTKEQVKVQRTGGQGTGTLRIEADYMVHVDLLMYPLDLHFHAASANRGLY
jgi:YbbR domain-containing protein